jgi:chaperone required for assembly of F1-ATPase
MYYQLSWKILPGLKGLSCSEFSAVATTAPNNDGGVALELDGEEERDRLLRHLEEHFAARRFTNQADAFEAVKMRVLQWRGEQ